MANQNMVIPGQPLGQGQQYLLFRDLDQEDLEKATTPDAVQALIVAWDGNLNVLNQYKNGVDPTNLTEFLKQKSAIGNLIATCKKLRGEARSKLAAMQKTLYAKHLEPYEKVLFRVVETCKKFGLEDEHLSDAQKVVSWEKIRHLMRNYELGYQNGISVQMLHYINKKIESDGAVEVMPVDDVNMYKNAKLLKTMKKQTVMKTAWKKGEDYQKYKSRKKDVSSSSSSLTESAEEEIQEEQVQQVHEERLKQPLSEKTPESEHVADLSTRCTSTPSVYEGTISVQSKPNKMWANLKDHQQKMAKLKIGTLIEEKYSNYRVSNKKIGWIRYGVKFSHPQKTKTQREQDREVPQSVYQSDKMSKALDMSIKALIREDVVKKWEKPRNFGRLFMIEQTHNGKLRLIYDWRPLNMVFRNTPINLPTIFNALSSNSYYWKVDIENCYYHFKLENEFSKNFGFHHKGENYIWKRMPFGWSLAPYVWVTMLAPIINAVKELHPTVKITAYMDDILLSSEDSKDWQEVTMELIGRLRDLGYRINEEKWITKARSVVEFIGYNISKQTIRNTKDRRKELHSVYSQFMAERNWKNLSHLSGLLNYMWMIIPALKAKASKITQMIPATIWQDRGSRTEHVKLNTDQFDTITNTVQLLLDNPCFVLPNNSRKLLVYVDASKGKLGFSQSPSNRSEIGKSKQALQSAYQATFIIPKRQLEWTIYQKELWAIQIAVSKVPANTDLLIYSDNQAAIASVKNGTGPDQVSQEMIDKIISTIFRRSVNLVVQYVDTEENYADFPSRNLIKNSVNSRIFSDASSNRMLTWNRTVNFFAIGKPKHIAQTRTRSIYDALQKTNRGLHTVYHEASTILSDPTFLSDPVHRNAVCKALIMRRVIGLASPAPAFQTLSKLLVSNHHLFHEYYIKTDKIEDIHEAARIAEVLILIKRKPMPKYIYKRKIVIYPVSKTTPDRSSERSNSNSSFSISLSNSSSSSENPSEHNSSSSKDSPADSGDSSQESSNNQSEARDQVPNIGGLQMPNYQVHLRSNIVQPEASARRSSPLPSIYNSSVLSRILKSDFDSQPVDRQSEQSDRESHRSQSSVRSVPATPVRALMRVEERPKMSVRTESSWEDQEEVAIDEVAFEASVKNTEALLGKPLSRMRREAMRRQWEDHEKERLSKLIVEESKSQEEKVIPKKKIFGSVSAHEESKMSEQAELIMSQLKSLKDKNAHEKVLAQRNPNQEETKEELVKANPNNSTGVWGFGVLGDGVVARPLLKRRIPPNQGKHSWKSVAPANIRKCWRYFSYDKSHKSVENLVKSRNSLILCRREARSLIFSRHRSDIQARLGYRSSGTLGTRHQWQHTTSEEAAIGVDIKAGVKEINKRM
jgi:hypothetical protein